MEKASRVVLVVKSLPADAGDLREAASIPGSRKIPWRRAQQLLQSSYEENPIEESSGHGP